MLGKLGYPMPALFGWAIALTEFVGGILLVLGLFTRPVALALLIFMLESTRFTYGMGGFFWSKGGAEYSILLALCAVYFLIRGGGPYSVDANDGQGILRNGGAGSGRGTEKSRAFLVRPRLQSFSGRGSGNGAARRTTLMVISPTLSMRATITSPGLTGPTPSGVPVMIMSPGLSV